jgi:hypothetical protein
MIEMKVFKKSYYINMIIRMNVSFEYRDTIFSDESLIQLFEHLNFSGTKQDKEHLNNLKNG